MSLSISHFYLDLFHCRSFRQKQRGLPYRTWVIQHIGEILSLQRLDKHPQKKVTLAAAPSHTAGWAVYLRDPWSKHEGLTTFLSLCWAYHQSNVFTKTPVEVSCKKLRGWPWLQSREKIWGNAAENIFIYSMDFGTVGKEKQLKEEKITFIESLLHLGPCLLAFWIPTIALFTWY